MLKRSRAETFYWLLIPAFFVLFFWPATLAGRFFVGGDALVYSYPLRAAMWEMIRHGQLPLWTPTMLSGYPLLSMAQLGLGYPLTWFYLVLPGYAAEQMYVLAPFLLAPIFTYAYARQIGRSRAASLLAGLGFGFGGMMASFIGTFGFLTNAVMWLPLALVGIERARTQSYWRCLLLMTFSFAMAILTGVGQGILYLGVLAIAYSCARSLVTPPSTDRTPNERFRLKAILRTFKPLLVCLIGMLLAIGLSAFQILETMRAQRLSIRSKLSYEVFSAGSFSGYETWKSFVAPLYNYQEVTSFITPLAALLAIVAIAAWFKSHDWHVLFWLAVAATGLLLMLGDHTPLYRLVYRLPLVNLFRVPSRHAFEWSFALAMLAAFGWDAANAFFAQRAVMRQLDWLVGVLLILACMIVSFAWWRATRPIAGSPIQHTGMPESVWLIWKLSLTLLVILAAMWCWRIVPSWRRSALLTGVVLVACFVEPYILLYRWWFHFAKPSSYYTQVSSPSQFLQHYPPQENRIYTSVTPGYSFDLPRTEPHNITARRGFHNAAGYEPLMLARYDRAFGNGGQFSTPNFSAPLDRQILNPNWRVLDLLNVRFLVEFSAGPSAFTEKDGERFAAAEIAIDLKPGEKVTLTGAAMMDTLTIVSALANSGDLSDGQPVAQIKFITADGRIITRELEAGRDSAEWAHERADVKQTIRHQLARIFDTRPGDGFPVYRYWSRFDLSERVNVDRIEVKNIVANASLIVSKVTAYDSNSNGAYSLTQALPEHWRKVYDQDSVQIYENPRALPRAWMVPKIKAVGTEEALKTIRGESNTEFDPRQIALVEMPEPPGPPETAVPGFPAGEFGTAPQSRIVNDEANHLSIETIADKQSMLVVSEINYPGWKATVDGVPAAIYPTDYLLRGVLVTAGRHRVEMRYTAPAARTGGVISALTLLLIAGLVVNARRR
jgi:hypothetical protein